MKTIEAGPRTRDSDRLIRVDAMNAIHRDMMDTATPDSFAEPVADDRMIDAVGLAGFPGDTGYSSSKGALFSFSKSLAHELALTRLRVNVVAPGFVETDMTADMKPAMLKRVLSAMPLGRLVQLDEIAKAIAFLVFGASYLTDGVVTIDGGWRK